MVIKTITGLITEEVWFAYSVLPYTWWDYEWFNRGKRVILFEVGYDANSFIWRQISPGKTLINDKAGALFTKNHITQDKRNVRNYVIEVVYIQVKQYV